MNLMFVSFYTEKYKHEAKQLKKTLDQFSLPHDLQYVTDLGSWQANTCYKPIFLLEMIDKWKKPVIWLDADSRIRKYPSLFKQLDCDMAVHYGIGHHKWVNSAVIYVNDTGCHILNKWIVENNRYPNVLDQINLQNILEGMDKISKLPLEYCFIFDVYRKMHPGHEPVIEQMQASRRLNEHFHRVREQTRIRRLKHDKI